MYATARSSRLAPRTMRAKETARTSLNYKRGKVKFIIFKPCKTIFSRQNTEKPIKLFKSELTFHLNLHMKWIYVINNIKNISIDSVPASLPINNAPCHSKYIWPCLLSYHLYQQYREYYGIGAALSNITNNKSFAVA